MEKQATTECVMGAIEQPAVIALPTVLLQGQESRAYCSLLAT